MRPRYTPSAFQPDALVPPAVFAGRGFAMSYAEAHRHADDVVASALASARAATPAPAAGAGAHVLLGGAGFLGSRLAAALLRAPGDAPVVLVSRRPAAVQEAWRTAYGDAAAGRLMAHPRLRLRAADLAAPALDWMDAVPRCAVVHHLAALVHAFGAFAALAPVNVGALLAAFRLAERDGALLQLASTLSVFVSSNARLEHGEVVMTSEADLWLYGGYAQTKAVADIALARWAATDRARDAGVRWQSVRYGLLVPEAGVAFPADSFAPTIARALDRLGALPDVAEEALVDLTPVDNAAAAALALAEAARRDPAAQGVFHWANPQSAPLSAFLAALEARRRATGGAPFAVEPAADWMARLAALPRLDGMLLRAAFAKSAFLAEDARRLPVLNADLFQSTGRRFGITRALGLGCVPPPLPDALLPGIAASALPMTPSAERTP